MEETIKEEFDRIKNNIIYMDWNIISYIRDPYEINNDELQSSALCLKKILFEILDRKFYVIPYSNAHMLDIYNGSKEYEKSSLKFLQNVSCGWQVSEDYNDKESLRLDKIDNIFCNYDEYHNYLIETNKYTDELFKILTPVFDLVTNYIEYTSDLQNLPDKNKEDLNDLISCLFPMNDEILKIKLLKKNKHYKFNLKDLEGKKIKFPNYESAKAKYPDKNIKEIVDLCIKMSDLPFSSLTDMINKISFNNNTPALSKFNNKINYLYFLAEFISISTEKLDSKTAFQGIVNDQFHLNYGLRCNYFITEDDALYKKSQFIKEWIQSGTRVFKIDDFNRFLLKKITNQTLQNSQNTSLNNGNEFNYRFQDNDGKIIKEYNISSE